MTIKDLYKYSKIKNEIKQIEDNISELETTIIGSSKITGMPINGNNISSPTERIGTKLINLKEKLTNKIEMLLDENSKIEKFIETIKDEDIRIIIRKRFLECKTWQQVGDETITDRTTPYYRLKKYLKNREKENNDK